MNNHLLLDCHAHIYPGFDLAKLCSSAIKNLNSLKQRSFLAREAELGIILTERLQENFFDQIADLANIASYQVTLEDQNCLSLSDEEQKLFIFRAKQLRSKEALELHIIGAVKKLDSQLAELQKLAINQILDFIQQQEDFALVIPWGFGKWLSKRGKLVSALFNSRKLLLGDSLMRPAFFAEKLFSREQDQILRGSDPLPYPQQENLIGRYASLIQLRDDQDKTLSEKLIATLRAQSRAEGRYIIEQLGELQNLSALVRGIRSQF